jgi:hypothetical protein
MRRKMAAIKCAGIKRPNKISSPSALPSGVHQCGVMWALLLGFEFKKWLGSSYRAGRH